TGYGARLRRLCGEGGCTSEADPRSVGERVTKNEPHPRPLSILERGDLELRSKGSSRIRARRQKQHTDNSLARSNRGNKSNRCSHLDCRAKRSIGRSTLN